MLEDYVVSSQDQSCKEEGIFCTGRSNIVLYFCTFVLFDVFDYYKTGIYFMSIFHEVLMRHDELFVYLSNAL